MPKQPHSRVCILTNRSIGLLFVWRRVPITARLYMGNGHDFPIVVNGGLSSFYVALRQPNSVPSASARAPSAVEERTVCLAQSEVRRRRAYRLPRPARRPPSKSVPSASPRAKYAVEERTVCLAPKYAVEERSLAQIAVRCRRAYRLPRPDRRPMSKSVPSASPRSPSDVEERTVCLAQIAVRCRRAYRLPRPDRRLPSKSVPSASPRSKYAVEERTVCFTSEDAMVGRHCTPFILRCASRSNVRSLLFLRSPSPCKL